MIVEAFDISMLKFYRSIDGKDSKKEVWGERFSVIQSVEWKFHLQFSISSSTSSDP